MQTDLYKKTTHYMLLSALTLLNPFVAISSTSADTSRKRIDTGISDLVLEIGDSHRPRAGLQRIWVQNSKVGKVVKDRGSIQIKALALGESIIRLDDKPIRLTVVPTGFKESFEAWQVYKNQFVDIRPGFCSASICLRGKIYSVSEFKKLMRFVQETGHAIYFGMDVAENLKLEISRIIDEYFRSHNLTPLKVSYGQPWRVYSSIKDELFQKRSVLQNVGVQWVESQQKIDLADNVSVEIKIIEVRKEFYQSLGIKWPSEFSAQVLNGQLLTSQNFDLALQAYERSGDMKILASPTLLCRSGKSAEFFAGGEFPIKISNFRQSGVVWKRYGIELKIKPVIDSLGQMSIEMETTISSMDKSRSVDQVPALHTHKVMSHFDMADSKTIVLSGLIKNESGQSREGLAHLTEIPVLGTLFSSRDFIENRTELVILVTPKLMKANP